MSDNGVSIKVSLEAHQELCLRKISTGVPISRQIEIWLKIGVKNAKNNITRKSNKGA